MRTRTMGSTLMPLRITATTFAATALNVSCGRETTNHQQKSGRALQYQVVGVDNPYRDLQPICEMIGWTGEVEVPPPRPVKPHWTDERVTVSHRRGGAISVDSESA